MVISDRIYSWFIKNIILSRIEIIDNPGFIICQFSPFKGTSLREIFIGEDLIQTLENKTKIYDYVLYSIGKIFGYSYASLSKMPMIKNVSKREFINFANLMVRYIETVYARNLKHTINLKTKTFILKMKDYIVCRKNGLGYLFSTGGVAGIWSYACQDKTIEAIQPKCQGRGDKECLVIAAPYETLVKMGYNPVKCTEIEEIKLTQEYKEFNSPKPCKWARNSLKSLIDAGFIKYNHGQVTFRGERFFLCEASFMYILEKELGKIKNGLKILWQVSFDFGKKLAELAGKQEPEDFIMDFFPALGFGDMLVLRKKDEYEIIVNNFPWFQDWEKIDFTMFRGILSGVISGLIKKQVELKKIEKYISSGTFTLHITT